MNKDIRKYLILVISSLTSTDYAVVLKTNMNVQNERNN